MTTKTKLALLLAVVLALLAVWRGAGANNGTVVYEDTFYEVTKFRDGKVVCYVYSGVQKGGIACLPTK